MKRLLACGMLGLGVIASLSVVACGDDDPATPADGGVDGGGTDTGTGTETSTTSDGGDGGSTSLLGFHASNLDNSPLLEATLAGPLGDVVLSDCGPQVVAAENGKMGCDFPGPDSPYKQIDGSGGDKKYTILVAKNITVAKDMILDVGQGDRPVILIALETIKIEGSIYVNPGFAGAYSIDNGSATSTGPGAGKASNATTGGSGGGGGFCGAGGKGGAAGATAGAVYNNAKLIPLQGGSAGGGLFAANGGGAIQLVAGREITLAAGSYIDAPGDGAVKGGGSGGAILLEAPSVKIAGTLTVNGGSGGAAGANDGKRGDRTSTPAVGGVPGDGFNGGNGGAGATVNGTDGILSTADPPTGNGSGSGGGGTGWIRINTRTGAAEITGLISPSVGGQCATQGTLQ